MKRIFPALALIALMLLLTVAGTLFTERVFSALQRELDEAEACARAEDYPQAQKALKDYEEVFEREEPYLLLFVDRDLLLETRAAGAALLPYADAEHKQDFLVELDRLTKMISSIRETQRRLI